MKNLYLCTRKIEAKAEIYAKSIYTHYLINKFIRQMMNHYETVFILTPVLSDEQTKETVAKFTKVLTDNGAEILNEENWGMKKMAYAINKKSTGFYFLVEFKLSLTSMHLSMLRSVVTNFLKKRRLKPWQKIQKSVI